jgi:hypothetical protein
MPTGTTTIDFGAFPGASDASAIVGSQTTILSSSFVEAWIYPTGTSDHSADEHMIEQIKVVAGAPVAGSGFTVYAICTSQVAEPLERHMGGGDGTGGPGVLPPIDQMPLVGGLAPRLYGTWAVAWVWV